VYAIIRCGIPDGYYKVSKDLGVTEVIVLLVL